MGSFDLVLASEVPRTVETAIAMGHAVDDLVAIPLEIEDPALAVIGHHERWTWDAPWIRFSEMIDGGGPVAALGAWLRDTWIDALESAPEDGRVLAISHGRLIEVGVVACLREDQRPDFPGWGEPLHHCEGVRLSYSAGRFHDPNVLRARRCAPAVT
jgi:broad specificity phosphatase PhoE